MCIRDRHTPGPHPRSGSGSCRATTSVLAGSRAARRAAAVPDLRSRALRLVPVSYTHLDVYKRQLVSLVVLVGVLGVLSWINPWIGLTCLVVVLAGSAVSLAQGRSMRAATRVMRRRRSLLTSNVDEQLGALHVVQAFGRSGGERQRLRRQNNSLNRALFRIAELRGRLRGLATGTAMLMVCLLYTSRCV